MELAYDDSYKAHFDQIHTPPNNDTCTTCEDGGQSSYTKRHMGRYSGRYDMSGTGAAVGEDRESNSNSNSNSINSNSSNRESSSNNNSNSNSSNSSNNRCNSNSNSTSSSRPSSRGNISNKGNKQLNENKQKRIAAVETDIINNLSAKIGPLRGCLSKQDISQSGVVNFEEFYSAMRQMGILSAKGDLEEVFNGAAEHRMGKGTVNNYETWEFDVTHSKCKAVDIGEFTERVVKAASELNEFQKDDTHNNCRQTQEQRAMKNILHITGKQSDPMRLYSHTTHGMGQCEGKGTSAGFFTPQKLKKNLRDLGSILTETDFDSILKKVKTGCDGKISLLDFDDLLHNDVRGYDSDNNMRRKKLLRDHNRYSRTFQSCDALNNDDQSEYKKIIDSRLGKKDSMKWGKLQGKILENCEKLPESFNNVAKHFSPEERARGRVRERKENIDIGNLERRRSRSLGSVVWGKYQNGRNLDLDSTGSMGSTGLAVTSSGRFYGKQREERESNTKNTELLSLPVSMLRNVLSDAGIQLGNDDIERLKDVVTREIMTVQPSVFMKKAFEVEVGVSGGSRSNSGINSGMSVCGEPSVSLERFCDILGIARNVNTVTSKIGKYRLIIFMINFFK